MKPGNQTEDKEEELEETEVKGTPIVQHGNLILVEVKSYIFVISSHWSQYQSFTHALGHH